MTDPAIAPVSERAFVALGSNLANPAAQVTRAIERLATLPQTRLLARSSLYRTAPVGYAHQPDFINAVVLLKTTLTPTALLTALLELEASFGRKRAFRNAPRVLDLDLLLYGELIHHEPGLTLPHPRMHERAFVLAPLVEIAPDCIIPGRGPARNLLKGCLHQGVQRIAA
jgi:2-amino-4-hydroxy-6-hydroxymethyldihydropteridine diphosphokinase